jgi:hypothetical protein
MYVVILKFISSSISYNSNTLKSQLVLLRHQRSQIRARFLEDQESNDSQSDSNYDHFS